MFVGHHHSHVPTGERLRNALALTLIILVVEVVAGLAANSLALLSDAGHILTDVFALGLAWFAARLSDRPPNERNTFGYRRSGILAALTNAATLIVISIVVLIEAVIRLRHPQHVSGAIIIPAAAAALAVNAYIAWILRREHGHDLNVRAAFMHVLGDLAASALVVVGGVVILVGRTYLIDPVLSIVIAALIGLGAGTILRDTVTILMESAPRGIHLDAVRAAMREVPGVEDVHDLHVWALSDGFLLLSAHAEVREQSLADTAPLLSDVKLLLRRRFGIEHATIELECIDCGTVTRRPLPLLPRQTAPGRGSNEQGASGAGL